MAEQSSASQLDRSQKSSSSSLNRTTATFSSKKGSKKTKEKDSDPGSCFCKNKKGGHVIHCDGCERWCHATCVGISVEVLKVLSEDKTNAYICPVCILKKFSSLPQEGGRDAPDGTGEIQRLVEEFDVLRKDVHELKKNMSELKQLIESRESSTATRSENFLADQNKILEIHERELRRNNVIVVGLKEEPERPTVDVVSKLFNEKLSVPVKLDEAKRLGRAKEGTARPILVRFAERSSKVSVMKKRSTLKGTGIFVNNDLTPFQKKIKPSY